VSVWGVGAHIEHDISSVAKLPSNFRVHTVDLPNCSSFEHTGADFEFLRSLADLQVVSIVGTRWGDQVANVLADGNQLRELRLAAANLSPKGLNALRGQRSLKWVDLHGNPLLGDDLAVMRDLLELQTLGLQGAGVSDKGLEQVAMDKAETLIELVLQENPRITDRGIPLLNKFKKLSSLNLAGTSVSNVGIAQLKPMLPQLENLALHAAPGITDDALAHLRAAKRLRNLNLWGTFVTDAGLAHLTDCKALVALDLGANRLITDFALEHLAKLPSLERLEVRQTQLTDAAVGRLAQITRLKHLDIRDARITETGYKQLKEALPNCQIHWERPADSPAAGTTQ
jgi:hypothetical protein